jgi:hypothetical protein
MVDIAKTALMTRFSDEPQACYARSARGIEIAFHVTLQSVTQQICVQHLLEPGGRHDGFQNPHIFVCGSNGLIGWSLALLAAIQPAAVDL